MRFSSYASDDDGLPSPVDGGSSTYLDDTDNETERDEIQELQKYSRKDTIRIRVWRMVMAAVLLTTACAVTLTTYRLLKQELKRAFRDGVSQCVQGNWYQRAHSVLAF